MLKLVWDNILITLKKLIFSVLYLFFLHVQSVYGGEFEFQQGLICESNGDFPKALSWYKKSDLMGNVLARERFLSEDFNKISFMFKCAKSTDEDLEPFSLKQRIEAQKALGIIFLYGHYGVQQNIIKAHDWLSKSAQNNDPESYYFLGQLSEYMKNFHLALEYYFIGLNLGDRASFLRYVYYTTIEINPAE